MRTTIDGAGRIVVPKAIRDAMGLDAGRAIDLVFTDGRIEVELAPVQAHVEKVDGFPLLVPDEKLPALSDEQICATVEATRR